MQKGEVALLTDNPYPSIQMERLGRTLTEETCLVSRVVIVLAVQSVTPSQLDVIRKMWPKVRQVP